jgi:NTP pyrophosphatase (non-canonical NTP hydrolase)
MEMDEYQHLASKFRCGEPIVLFAALGVAGEAGEVADKVKKAIRDNNGNFDDKAFKESVKYELGDVLWYVAALAEDLGFTLSEVGQSNIAKLEDRRKRGVIHGSGDKR